MKKLLLSILLVSASFGLTKAQTTILSEDFEGGAVPASWNNITNATDGGWIVGDAATLSTASFPIDAHTTIAATNDDACIVIRVTTLLLQERLTYQRKQRCS